MEIVYHYILYLRSKSDLEMIETHIKPFRTKEAAEHYKIKCDEIFKERLYFSKIRRTDLSRSKDGLWIS